MEARVDHTQMCVQLRATFLILPCIALSAVSRSSEERLIHGFVFLPCSSRGDLENSNVLQGQSSPAGPAAGAQTHLGASSELGKRQEGLNLQSFGDYIINVANNELCSCGVCLGREPGGSFKLFKKETNI